MRFACFTITIFISINCIGQTPADAVDIIDFIKSVRKDTALTDSAKVVKLRRFAPNSIREYPDSVTSIAEYEIGYLFYLRNAMPDSAITHYIQAYHRTRDNSPETRELKARAAYYVVRCAIDLNDHNTARAYLARVLKITPHRRYQARALKDMATFYRKNGDYHLAKSCLEQTNQLLAELQKPEAANFFTEEVVFGFTSGSHKWIDYTVQKADSIIVRLEQWHLDDNIDDRILYTYYQNIAIAYEEMHLLDEAVSIYDRGLQVTTTILQRADFHNNIGRLLIRQGRFTQATEFLRSALQDYQSVADLPGMAATYDNLGAVALYTKQFNLAHLRFDSALAFIVGKPITNPPTASLLADVSDSIPVSNSRDLLTILLDKARTYNAQYEIEKSQGLLDSALILHTACDAIIDRLRGRLGLQESQFDWRRLARGIYEPAVLCGIDAQNTCAIIEFSDRGKSLVLEEHLSISNSSDPEIQYKYSRIIKAHSVVDSLTQVIYRNNEKESQSTTARGELVIQMQELNDLKSELCDQFPDLCGRFELLELCNLDLIQSNLSSNQSLLSYFLTTDTIICLQINPTGDLTYHFLGSRHLLDSLLSELAALWQKDVTNLDENQYVIHLDATTHVLSSLYQLLIEPLGELPPRLVIIPDENLHSLNFDMLLETQPDPGTSLARYPFMVRKHAITYGHSIKTWMHMEETQPGSHSLVGYIPGFGGSSYSSLEVSRASLEGLSKFYRYMPRTGTAANRANLSHDSKKANIHFETHAVLNDSISNFSFLLLNDPQGSLDTFFLQEIYQLDLPGSYVAIPNCETHLGEMARGEGVISLARAFTYAGASSIITSLWIVKEQPSARIMTDFYSNMSEGTPKDLALQEAKLAYIDNARNELQAHPYVWASLIHIGNNKPLKDHRMVWPWLAGGVLAIGIGYLISKRRSIKREHPERAA